MTVAAGPGWALHLGKFEDVLEGVECDALISDPPYGGRTHEGHNAMGAQTVSITGQATREAIVYDSWTPTDVDRAVSCWGPRVRGWIACMTSDGGRRRKVFAA